MSLSLDINTLLLRELEGFRREIALFPDDESIWRVTPGVTNSAGNLALHVAGNLQHFVGTCLGGSTYLRQRDVEFSTRGATRGEVDRQLQAAIAAVATALAGLDDASLQQPMSGAPNGMVARTGMFLLHLVAHTAFHLGQAGYIRRVVTGDDTSASPLPLDVLVDRTSV
jgi:uncharacterized damage-inducible protein DinB